MKQLQEELTSAEVWEAELRERLKKLEEKVKPSLMKFCNQLEMRGSVEEDVIEESIMENDAGQVFTVLKRRMLSVQDMGRCELVGMMKTVLGVRNCLSEKDSQEGVEMMQEMARNILKQMGRFTISWLDLQEWEVIVMKSIMREVEGIPEFVQRMVDQLLNSVTAKIIKPGEVSGK